MCGIIGIIGSEPAAPQLIDALKRLEYRGYDSAGVATLEARRADAPARRRQAEKPGSAARCASRSPARSASATPAGRRMAGRPRTTPIRTPPNKLAVVHNGIIENFAELRRELEAKGAKFATETDTEVIAHLVTEEMKRGASPVEAVKAALPRLRGAFALAFLFAGEDNLLIGARQGSPLAIGFGDGAMFVGSDAIALAPFTDTVSYLEDGDWVIVTRDGAEIHDADGKVVQRAVLKSQASVMLHRQGQPSPFHGQGDPRAARSRRPHAGELSRHGGRARGAADGAAVRFPRARSHLDRRLRHRLLRRHGRQATGSSASRNCRSRSISPPSSATATCRSTPGNLAIFVSQSGETADTLASLRYAREHKQHVLSIVNVPTSTIARESDIVMPTLAGPEIGVASTKAFTCQLAALAALAIAAGRARGVLAESDEKKLVHALIEVPRHLDRSAGARAADRAACARSRQMPRRALSRPRHQLSDRARRRAQAQGNLLHPRRGLCGGRTQARPDRADRRDHAGHRDRAARQGVRQDRLQHAGSRRARRPADPGDRRQGRGRGR